MCNWHKQLGGDLTSFLTRVIVIFPSEGPRYRHIGEEQQTDLAHACCQTLASASTVNAALGSSSPGAAAWPSVWPAGGNWSQFPLCAHCVVPWPAATTAGNLFASLNEMGEQQKSHESFSVVFTDISGSSLCGGTKLFWVKFQVCYFGVCLDAQSISAKAALPEPGSGRGLFPLNRRSSSLLLPSSVYRGSSDCWGLCLQY